MTFDEDAAATFAALRAARLPRFESLTPQAARAALVDLRARAAVPKRPVGVVRDLAFDGPAGALTLRLYRPIATDGALPCLVFCHGGGFVVG
ncbi:MAG: alpha/beta hydrolase, partial [Rhizobiaceae bacterium]